jgi:glutamyl-tRNA synthetase
VEREAVVDAVSGRFVGLVDDVVVQRNDGVPAYNLAVVVDDHLQGVTQVVRGDDLLTSTPRQVHLQRLLGYGTPEYAHVPLVLGPDGARLAKRHGAVTMKDLAARGLAPRRVLALLGASLGLCGRDDDPDARALVDAFELARLPREPWRPELDVF